MNTSLLSIAAAFTLTALGASAASAEPVAPTPGQWTLETTTVTTNAHFNTIGVCLKADGSWTSTAQRRGSGRWLVSGTNTVLWRGNYEGGLNDAAVLTAISGTAMAGPLMQWVLGTTDTTNTATENVYARSVWRFKSAICDRSL